MCGVCACVCLWCVWYVSAHGVCVLCGGVFVCGVCVKHSPKRSFSSYLCGWAAM